MPTQSSAIGRTDAPVFRRFPRYAGLGILLFGLLMIVSWHAHWRAILQSVPQSAPVQYNTALCFVLTGTGLFLLTTRRAALAPWLAVIAASFALLTLLEYFGGWDFGIDQMAFKPYFEVDTVFPGRMSPRAAACFIFIGLAIALVGARKKWTYRLTAAAVLSCIVVVIASVALLSFVFGMEPTYNWGAYSKMAINTAAAFLILAGGVLLWSWLTVRRENLNFVRWLPVTASVTLMVMITFVSAVNGVELEKATFRLKRTVKVILAAQSFEKNLIELQRAGLGLTTAGEADGFDSRQSGRNLEPEQLNRLVELTSENPRQQQRLKDLSAAMKGVFGYDWRATSLKRPPGSVAGPGRVGLDNVGAAIDRARAILKAFSLEEQGLLDRSDISEQSHVQSAARLLIFGSVVAATLLVGANFMVGREINRRQRVELEREKLIGELRQLLDEVKILSGMIPICGWCKSIRSDEGYWQSVEQYVRAHTDATFTHGICPSCAEKLKAELRQADPAGVG